MFFLMPFHTAKIVFYTERTEQLKTGMVKKLKVFFILSVNIVEFTFRLNLENIDKP